VSTPPGRATPPAPPEGELEYVGFWLRVGAALVDSLWLLPVIWILGSLYENAGNAVTEKLLGNAATVSVSELTAALAPSPADFAVQYLVPAVLVVAFWMLRSATPGKMMLHARIVDATTGAPPTKQQLLIRYLGYYVSMLPLFLGLLWVGLDPRKQGWHDKLANTVVVRPKLRPSSTVTFPGRTPR
jgi:uncharacterized RDD family membrane protein YckC